MLGKTFQHVLKIDRCHVYCG